MGRIVSLKLLLKGAIMPSHDNEKVIAVLSCFRKQAELRKPAQNDERVWDRVERLAELSSVQGHTNTSTQQRGSLKRRE